MFISPKDIAAVIVMLTFLYALFAWGMILTEPVLPV